MFNAKNDSTSFKKHGSSDFFSKIFAPLNPPKFDQKIYDDMHVEEVNSLEKDISYHSSAIEHENLIVKKKEIEDITNKIEFYNSSIFTIWLAGLVIWFSGETFSFLHALLTGER